MEAAKINVIIGTPTYAIPAWMAKSHPDVIAATKKGNGIYGARQIMDITHPVYLFYAERVIRKLMECAAHRKCVVGFQLDNETKYYETAGNNVQQQFIKYLREKFSDNLEQLNQQLGLDYWSNRIDAWEDFPDVRGTINGSLGAEFQKFQRSLVSRFLSWQAAIVEEYRRPDQFITHNFDFDWRGYSYGVQPMVNHFQAAKCLTIAGVDIYHPSQDQLTGEEIAFGGDMMRSLKGGNYLVLETEAQGFPNWLPYQGQLRLQAFSHLASGANSVLYWHWHSIHNSFETYWKGLLSHDFAENDTYREAKTIGRDFKRLSDHLINLKKQNQVAILVSNEALTALEWFPVGTDPKTKQPVAYNDIVRWIYNQLYRMNIECDFIWPESEHLEQYQLIIVPALYSASNHLLQRLTRYIQNGGHLFATFKTGFTNEFIKVSHDVQPHLLTEALGIKYHQFTCPNGVTLCSDRLKLPDREAAEVFMELLEAKEAEILASYRHYNWNSYAAITRNHYGKGAATYLGCKVSDLTLKILLKDILKAANIQPENNDCYFPIILRKGKNQYGKTVRFFLNYSAQPQTVCYQQPDGTDLISGQLVSAGTVCTMPPWGFLIIEENK